MYKKNKSKNCRNTEANNTQDISNINYYKINNTISSTIKIKNDFEEEEFEIILNNVKNEENKVLQILLDLDKEEQKIYS